jgi:hypothetical protein
MDQLPNSPANQEGAVDDRTNGPPADPYVALSYADLKSAADAQRDRHMTNKRVVPVP